MKKGLVLALAMLLCALTVFASGSSESKAPSSGPRTIVWAGWSGEEEASRDIFAKMRSQYESSNGNKVEWVGWTWADTAQQILIRLRADSSLI